MKSLSSVFVPALFLLLFFSSCERNQLAETSPSSSAVVEPPSTDGAIIPDQYIITFHKEAIKPAWDYVQKDQEFANREEQGKFLDAKGLITENEIKNFLLEQNIDPQKTIFYYNMAQAGLNIKLTQEEYERVASSEAVEAIQYDRTVQLETEVVEIDPGTARAQTVPCGINRHGGFVNNNRNKWVWIVDTGIDLDHPDLNVVRHASRTYAGGSPDDCNGHGSHVAGTIGAKNNHFGVVGMAAGAPLVAVKVLNCSGNGTFGQIMSGFNYINSRATSGDVVNASLGGGWANCGNQPALNPIRNLGNRGIRVVIAAGNDGRHAKDYYPACVNGPGIITVANMTCGRRWNGSSNYGNSSNGSPIDYIATGTNVYSTYSNGRYATLTGTSMAAPHVAGIFQARNANYPRTIGSVRHRNYNYKIAGR